MHTIKKGVYNPNPVQIIAGAVPDPSANRQLRPVTIQLPTNYVDTDDDDDDEADLFLGSDSCDEYFGVGDDDDDVDEDF